MEGFAGKGERKVGNSQFNRNWMDGVSDSFEGV